MPSWNPPRGTSPDVIARWNAYYRALERHEQQHGEHGKNAAREALAAVSSTPAAAACPDTDAAANRRGMAVIERWRQADVDYDKRTSHGRTEGAVFP